MPRPQVEPGPAALVVMGRVVGAFGVQGWLKVQAYTESPEALADYGRWWLARSGAGEPRPHRVLEARRHGAFLLAHLEGVGSREEAASCRGSEVRVPREALPEVKADEVYVADLVGCRVVNRQGETLGTVAGVDDGVAQRLLRVKGDGAREMLIPWVDAYVDSVDLEAGTVGVDWQPGY
jgi:16S rRNA processing protein RimM